MSFVNIVCTRIPDINTLMISDVGYDPTTSSFMTHQYPLMFRCLITNNLELMESFQLREIQRRMTALSGVGFRVLTPQFSEMTPFYLIDTGQVMHLQSEIVRYILIDHDVEVVVVPYIMVEGAATFIEWQVVMARIGLRRKENPCGI